MNKILLTLTLVLYCAAGTCQPAATEKTVTFRFVPGEDMFYIPWKGNDTELDRLGELIDRYRTEISNGSMPVYVDSYTASMREGRGNKHLAFVRANRVKSELILHNGLTEDNFITRNLTEIYTDPQGEVHKDIVVVSLRIPEGPIPPLTEVPEEEEPLIIIVEPEPEPVAEQPVESEVRVEILPRRLTGWYVGANVGMPFFWGDFTSTAADKTYIGASVGIYGGYHIRNWLGVNVSLDYAVNKTGHRGYAAGYLLDPAGMTWYTPQSGSTARYDDLYGRISMFSAGIHADLTVNRIFGRRAMAFPLKLIVSPAVYGNTFSPKIYTKSDDSKYVSGNMSSGMSLGVGGDLILRYDINYSVGIQLKGTGMWITDNGFDNIRTIGHVRQNAMWGVSAGVVWRLYGNK